MISSVELDACRFISEDVSSVTFRIEKPIRGVTVENEMFEANVYTSIITLLLNKLVRIDELKGRTDSLVVFQGHLEKAKFIDLYNIKPKFNKLLGIESSLFHAFIKSAQAFSDSVAITRYSYSASFAMLVYVIENMANTAYLSMHTKKRRKIVKFCCDNVDHDQFLKEEIRQLEFTGKSGNEESLFQKLLHRSYVFRCNYVHEAENIPVLCQIADKLSMAFVSNDQKTLFPSYFWLRRIAFSALNNFLENQPSVGKNRVGDYVQPHIIGRFKAKKPVSEGQWITENDVRLQRIDDDFLREEYLHA